MPRGDGRWYVCPGCGTEYKTNKEACACDCDWRVDRQEF